MFSELKKNWGFSARHLPLSFGKTQTSSPSASTLTNERTKKVIKLRNKICFSDPIFDGGIVWERLDTNSAVSFVFKYNFRFRFSILHFEEVRFSSSLFYVSIKSCQQLSKRREAVFKTVFFINSKIKQNFFFLLPTS